MFVTVIAVLLPFVALSILFVPISNPPIVPPLALTEPLISKPAADADRNVTAPLFILIASEFMDT